MENINSKTGCQRNWTDFQFSNQNLDFRFSINIPIC